MTKKNDQVKVRILPGRGIGGYGDAGAEVTMSKEEADSYIQQGYVELVEEKAEPAVIHSEVDAPEEEVTEAKPVMKPETRRSRGKGKK